ncbi:hypothetical protein HDU79_000805 [Rhizoclosmatium sp. JEL0117]|nr:hypothetical protein HDU79_000805 [Rhizoclosmatium sp. JEL0117]
MSNLTFIGSTYERYIQAWPDCNGFEYPISVDPTPDQLTCLAFSLPSNFLSPSVDSIANGPLASYMSFTNTSAACGGSDLISRLTTVYNRTIRVMFTVGLTYNKDENVAAQPHFVEGVYSQFMLNAANSNVSSPNFLNENGVKARRGGPGTAVCWISWISTTTQAKGQYVLAYKNPVCGSKAPKIVDSSVETLENFAISYFFEQPQFYHGIENTSVFAAAYNIDISAVTYVSISDSKFDVIVTSDSGAQSDENSCVYKYRLADRDIIVRNMTLISYDFGSLPVSNLTTPADGCITAFNVVSHLSEFVFTNSSAVCGNITDYSGRFQRYFSVPVSVIFRYLDIADGIFHISISTIKPDARRDGSSASFVFFDKNFIQTTTTSETYTFSSASTTLTSIFTSTYAKASVSSTTATSTASSATAFIPTTTTSTITPTSTAVSTLSSSFEPTAKASSGVQSSGSSVKLATTAAVPTDYITPTGYAVPTAYGGPTDYGATVGSNIYKGASYEKVGIISALFAALALAF